MAQRLADLDAAIDRFRDRHTAAHPIPPITDPLGSSWDQPDRSRIEIDSTHALMDKRTFEELMEYSGTNPSGVYAGKMWRRHDGLFDHAFRARGGRPQWRLCWFGLSERPGFVSNNCRLILLGDGDLPEAAQLMIYNLHAALDRIIPGNGYSISNYQAGGAVAAMAILLWLIISSKRV